MQLRTYTGLWNVENRMYKFYDINLPFPISVKQLIIGLGTTVPWFFIMHVVGMPFRPPFGELVWIFPPAIATWWGSRPVAEGKNLVDFLSSQIRYFMGAKVYTALTPNAIDTPPTRFGGKIWIRS